MIKTVLRYGSLLGVLLVLFEFLRNANRLTFLDERAYIGAIAFLFLCGGILLARSFQKPKIVEKPRVPATVKPNPDLSDRERDVLSYLVHGFTNAEIANSAWRNPKYRQNAFEKSLRKAGSIQQDRSRCGSENAWLG